MQGNACTRKGLDIHGTDYNEIDFQIVLRNFFSVMIILIRSINFLLCSFHGPPTIRVISVEKSADYGNSSGASVSFLSFGSGRSPYKF